MLVYINNIPGGIVPDCRPSPLIPEFPEIPILYSNISKTI